jgi:glycosyltransferase-like protein
MSLITNNQLPISTPPLRIALFTYSTKPRGGVVHTLALAEHLQGLGHHVHVYALGKDENSRFFRDTSAPFTLIPAGEASEDEPLDERIQRYIQTYYQFITQHRPGPFDIYHAQDCISANALWRAREAGVIPGYVRTIHHIDDFTSPSLIECQNNSVYRPDHRLVVSRYWQQRLAAEFRVETTIIHNGVDVSRFRPARPAQRAEARAYLGLGEQLVILNIGGVEPRKNSIRLLQAFEVVHQKLADQGKTSVLVLAGGDTLLDYQPYRDEFAAILAQSVLKPGRDIFLRDVVPETEIPLLYHAADVLAFPSVKEGWGLVVLEAMASGVAVLAADLPVFREYLHPEKNAILVDPLDTQAIAIGLLRLAQDDKLRQYLAAAGPAIARNYSWLATAEAHLDYYYTLLNQP